MSFRRYGIARLVAATAVASVMSVPTVALAHPDRPHMGEADEDTSEPMPLQDSKARKVRLVVRAPSEALLGERVRIEAVLTTRDGQPVEGAELTFLMPVSWGEWYGGEAEIGTARTDERGSAWITTQLRRAGPIEVHVSFGGDETYAAAERPVRLEIAGDDQLYTPDVGLRLPGVGIWVVAALLAIVWALYLLVGVRLLGIARAGELAEARAGEPALDRGRRRLLRAALPVALQTFAAAAGGGLLALIARSPHTHSNLGERVASGYRRTPPAFVGAVAQMRPMPEPLERAVSFSREVHPILLAKGGPHAVPPEHQPAPAGVRLDTYENMMKGEGLVVPGKPEESELLSVFLDPAMRMPPSGLELTDDEIRLIVSWVAQGARDN